MADPQDARPFYTQTRSSPRTDSPIHRRSWLASPRFIARSGYSIAERQRRVNMPFPRAPNPSLYGVASECQRSTIIRLDFCSEQLNYASECGEHCVARGQSLHSAVARVDSSIQTRLPFAIRFLSWLYALRDKLRAHYPIKCRGTIAYSKREACVNSPTTTIAERRRSLA